MTLVRLNNRPDKAFNMVENLLNEFPSFFKDETGINWRQSVPVNIKETKDAYQLEVVAPGFDKSDFKISLEKNILTLSAEKKNEVKDDSDNNRNEKQVLREYSYRSFKRSFTLDEKIDEEKIEAKYVNG